MRGVLMIKEAGRGGAAARPGPIREGHTAQGGRAPRMRGVLMTKEHDRGGPRRAAEAGDHRAR
jgi:hypothetical protein